MEATRLQMQNFLIFLLDLVGVTVGYFAAVWLRFGNIETGYTVMGNDTYYRWLIAIVVLMMIYFLFRPNRGFFKRKFIEEMRMNLQTKAAIRTWIVHFKRDREFRKKYILFFYITMVLFKTLINRDMWMNPLCDVWGVWGIYRYNTVTGQRILTSECIENFFLLMPYIVLMFWNFEEKIFGKKVYIGKIILKSIQIAFLSSLTIELLQLFLRLGTFQISDLFFNTIGGLAGGIIYFLVNAVAERIRRIRN